MLSIDVPDEYGYVLFTVGVLPSITAFVMGGKVMLARKKFKVGYPNLYAVPGHHEKADEFNRVQRGHQSMFESLSDFRANSLIAGLKFPVPVAILGVVYCLGNYLYQAGYSDTSLHVSKARHLKGGPLKFLSSMILMGLSGYTAISFCK